MNRVKIAVVGAGVAGLAVAVGCEAAGHAVTLYEAKPHIGGRMETVEVAGHPLDVGFHVLHTAYPTVKRWLNVQRLEAKAMDNCTVTIHPSTGRKRLLGDALKKPRYLLPTLKSVGVGDGFRFFKWRMGTKASDLERALDRPSSTIAVGLRERRFRRSTRRVLEPLFAGITLDPTLSERFAFADFTWGAMSHGDMVVPKGGIAAVPQQLRERLTSTKVRLNTAITSVTSTSVTTPTGTEDYERVVLAVPQHVTATLLPASVLPHSPVERITSTVVFQTPRPPFKHARLLLNEQWGEDGRSVLHVHLPTNLHPHPQGHHWVVATLVGDPARKPDVDAVRNELVEWFGSQVRQWDHVAGTTVRHALPHLDPEHHERRLAEVEVDGVVLVGDHRAHPSVQGALASAERALEHLGVPLPGEVLA